MNLKPKRKRAVTREKTIKFGFGEYVIDYDAEDGTLYKVTDSESGHEIDEIELLKDIQMHAYSMFDEWTLEHEQDLASEAAFSRRKQTSEGW